MKDVQPFLVIVVSYILCHGLTTFLIAPVQSIYFPEITVFASLVYLPHGVRILATWMRGWKAVLPLFVGGVMSAALFNTDEMNSLIGARVFLATMLGAVVALVAFELIQLLGVRLYSDNRTRMNWKWLLVLGAFASVLNSVGSIIVHSGQILPELELPVLLTYAIGDTVGLFVCMIFLMLVFRWIRLLSDSEGAS